MTRKTTITCDLCKKEFEDTQCRIAVSYKVTAWKLPDEPPGFKIRNGLEQDFCLRCAQRMGLVQFWGEERTLPTVAELFEELMRDIAREELVKAHES